MKELTTWAPQTVKKECGGSPISEVAIDSNQKYRIGIVHLGTGISPYKKRELFLIANKQTKKKHSENVISCFHI